MNADTVVEAIIRGDLDGDINLIWDALSGRHKILKQQKAQLAKLKLKDNDRVVLSNFRESSGLNGCTAVIEKRKQTKCDIILGDDYKGFKYRPGAKLTVPMACCEKISG